jgi:uncharacterized protein DUF998
MTQAALVCGILSSLWYAAINVLVPMLWPAYSPVNQTVSELSAIDAPTRDVWIIVALPYVLLFAAFGWGVLHSATQNRKLFVVGCLIIFYCIFNAYWPPMHLREVIAAGGGTLSDTLHLVWACITTVLFMLIMGFAAFALSKNFRIYTAVSMVLLIGFGVTTFLIAPNVGANLPTPFIGVWERINIGIFLIWVIAFAAILLKTHRGMPAPR